MAGEIKLKLPPLHPGQREVFDSKARFKVVCCGRRWGKTHLGVLLCILCAARGGRAWWIGPTYPTARIGWRLLRTMVVIIPGVEIRESEMMIVLPNGGIIQVKSADKPDSLRGDSLDLVVFDEAADIKPEAWFEAIRPALADRKGHALFIGTPRGMDNWFYDIWIRASKDTSGIWEAWQRPTVNNPYIDPDEVEDARGDMHPIIFNQEHLAEFVVGGGTVFQQSWEKWYQLIGDQRVYTTDSSLVLMDKEHLYENVSLRSCLRFGTSDVATSVKTSADYTVISAWALTPQKRLCLLDFTRGRMEGPELIPAMMQMRSRWKLAWMGMEKVAFQHSLIQQARRRGMPVREMKPDKDKLARAYTAAAHMQGDQVWWRKTIVNMDDFAMEVRNFPLAAHDDCVDTLSYACSNIDRLHNGPQITSW